MTSPFVGLPTNSNAGCAYAVDLDQPTCSKEVTKHIIGWAEGWGCVALDTCDDHEAFAKLGCSRIVDEHPSVGCNGEHYAKGDED